MTVIVQQTNQTVVVHQDRQLTSVVRDLTPSGTVVVNPAILAVAKIVSDIVVKQFTPAYTVVTVKGEIADSNNTNHIGRIAGITIYDSQANVSTPVIVVGEVTNPLWTWAQGDELCLHGVGALSSTPPTSGFVQKIATALSNQRVGILFSPPIRL